MWSRSGMLRSTLSTNGSPVYKISWSADDSSIVYCCGEFCFIKALKSQVIIIFGFVCQFENICSADRGKIVWSKMHLFSK